MPEPVNSYGDDQATYINVALANTAKANIAVAKNEPDGFAIFNTDAISSSTVCISGVYVTAEY